MNLRRLLRFFKYFLMLFFSLNFVSAFLILTLNPGPLLSAAIVVFMTVIGVVVAARDAGYIHWF
jgi:hypothetical protein